MGRDPKGPWMLLALNFPDISPTIFSFEIFGVTLALRWYALAYVAGILLGTWLIAVFARRPELWAAGKPALTPKQAEALVSWLVVSIILGGRLGYVLLYRPAHYLENPGEILRVWEGGMSFHGGFLGVIIAAVLFARLHQIPLASLGDCMAAVTPIGLFLGRLANFINAELWGRPTDLPWGVVFPGEGAQSCATALAACARHPTQVYEALLEGALLFAVMMWLVWRRGALKTPGLLTGVFFLFYGLSRFLVEFVRQADGHYITADNPLGHVIRLGAGPDAWGLSMGQVLSLPMILVGLVVIWRSRAPR
jgi:phosphatidylglycerol---prolipoprotein diacylglyceryl transferase